jgi:streptomycin 6-kinase
MENVEVPAYFLEKAARQFGADGPGWVSELPSILSWCVEEWELRGCRPASDLSINMVAYAESRAFGPVVLKIEGPHTERDSEREALKAYAGRHACALLRHDERRGALLLERLVPGATLRSLPDREEQLRVGVELMERLPVPPPAAFRLPTYREWMDKAFTRVRREGWADGGFMGLLDAAEDLYAEITAGETRPVLLHGDLHHDNILSAGDGRWKVIDPQGVIGPAFLECGRFLENHLLPNGEPVDPEPAAHAVRFVAESLGRTPRQAAGAFFILHLLSTCWGQEMAYDQAELSSMADRCRELLSLAAAL